MRDFTKQVLSIVERSQIEHPTEAIIRRLDDISADIQTPNSSGTIKNVPIRGDASKLQVGQTVSIIWEERAGSHGLAPVVLSAEANSFASTQIMSVVIPDDVTIHNTSIGIAVKKIGQQHLDFVPALDPHSHPSELSELGWQTSDSGTLIGQFTSISRYGQISLGQSPNMLFLDGMHNTYRLWIGTDDPTLAPFSIESDGSIRSTDGTIGGWTIGESTLSSGSIILDASIPAIRVGATDFSTGIGFFVGYDGGDYVLRIGDPAGDQLTWDGSTLSLSGTFQSANYLTNVRGWQINNDGTAEFQNVLVRGEIQAVVFSELQISPVGGWLMITKDQGLLPAEALSGATQINFGRAMTPNDFVIFRDSGSVEYMRVGTLVSGTTYNVTRNLDGSGANTWEEGTIFVVIGDNGDGRIELNAYNTPRISLLTAGSTYNGDSEVVRIGDLNSTWGYSSETYGMSIGVDANSRTGLLFDPTNGIRIMYRDSGGNRVAVGQWAANGDLTLGRVSTNKANIFFDESTGRLQFRGGTNGTVVQSYFDTDGSFISGDESFELSSSGLRIGNSLVSGVDNLSIIPQENAVNFANAYGLIDGAMWFQNNTDTEQRTLAISIADPIDLLEIGGGGFSLVISNNQLAEIKLEVTGSSVRSIEFYAEPHGRVFKMSTGVGNYSTNLTQLPIQFEDTNTADVPTTPHPPDDGFGIIYTKYNRFYFQGDDGLEVPLSTRGMKLQLGGALLRDAGATFSTVNSVPSISLGGTSGYASAFWGFHIPEGWSNRPMTVRVTWAKPDANSGAVRIYTGLRSLEAGSTVAAAYTSNSATQTVTGHAAYYIYQTDIEIRVTTAHQNGAALAVYRDADNASDTYASAIHILAVEIYPGTDNRLYQTTHLNEMDEFGSPTVS